MNLQMRGILVFGMILGLVTALVGCGGESPTGSKVRDGRLIVKNELPEMAYGVLLVVEVKATDEDGKVTEVSVDPGTEKDVFGVSLKGGTKIKVDLVVHARGDRTKSLEVEIDGNRVIRVIDLGPRGAAGGLEVEVS